MIANVEKFKLKKFKKNYQAIAQFDVSVLFLDWKDNVEKIFIHK